MGRTSASFKLTHIYDPKKDVQRTTSSSSSSSSSVAAGARGTDDGTAAEAEDVRDQLETAVQRKKRYRSLAVVCVTGFTFNIAFSLVLTSAYPYLVAMEDGDETGLKEFLGYVVAAQPLAQLFFSPLMGFLGNKFGTVRYLMMVTMIILSGGFVFYACIHALPPPRKYYLIVARFIIGAAAGTTTLCFSYVAGATTVSERTQAFGLFNFALASAFVLGPVIQSAFVPLGEEGIDMGSDLKFSIYTGPSWVAAILAALNLLLYVPGTGIFKEYYIAAKEGALLEARSQAKNGGKNEVQKNKIDKVAIVALLFIFSFVNFNFIFLETLLTPMTMDFLGWTEEQAILYIGFAFAAGGLYSGVCYAVVGPLSRKFSERLVLIFGVVLLILGPVVFLPFGSHLPPRKWNTTTVDSDGVGLSYRLPFNVQRFHHEANAITSFNSPENLTCFESGVCGPGDTGCPLDQSWCDTMPRTEPAQMIVGFFFVCSGFPLGVALASAIYSKVLGPGPQGTAMGLLQAAGCLARVLCPILVTALYANAGTWGAMGFMIAVMAAILTLTLVVYRRLVPFQADAQNQPPS